MDHCRSITFFFFLILEVTVGTRKPMPEWSRKLEKGEHPNNHPRVLRSPFLDPNEIGIGGSNHNHDQMNHDKHMNENSHNDTNVQNEDPHGNKQFCVDISEYLDLKWVIKESEECLVSFNRYKKFTTSLNLLLIKRT